MKKLIAVVTLMLVFSIGANAQVRSSNSTKETRNGVKETPKEVKETTKEVKATDNVDPIVAAKKDADEMAALLNLTPSETANFARLFEMKHNTLQDKNLSQERRTEMSRIMEAKIRATLDEKQMQILEGNPALFKKLIN